MKSVNEMSPLEAALYYASKGWSVIPVHSITAEGFCSCGARGDHTSLPKHNMGKQPYLGELGHRDSSREASQIREWWEEWPHANVAIATGSRSDIIVLDVDKKNGGLETLRELQFEYGKLPFTPTVISGGGGRHFYFSYPGYEIRGRRGMRPGLDVRADGGAIVAPPSNHKLRTLYQWDSVATSEVPLAEIPDWLLGMIMEKQSKRRRVG